MSTAGMPSATTGINLKIAAALCMTLMLACIKALDGAVPPGQIAFYRAAVTLLPLLIWILWKRSAVEVFRFNKLARHFGRGVSGSISMFLSFVTVACLPLADAVLLGYAAPLMTVFLALYALKERVPGYRWAGAIVGSIGVVIALSPHLGAWHDPGRLSASAILGIATGLVGALFGALSIIQIRSLAATEAPGAIVFYYMLMTGVLGLMSMPFGWATLDLWQLALLSSAGLFGGLANLLIAQSLRCAHASVTAPFEYTTLLWSALISYSVFDQAPGLSVLVGGSLVAASGAFTVWRETRGMSEARSAG